VSPVKNLDLWATFQYILTREGAINSSKALALIYAFGHTLQDFRFRERLWPYQADTTTGTAVRLRVIQLRLPVGPIETLVTRLSEEEMPEEAFGKLYALRWRIEIHYGQEKYPREIENFSGILLRVIAQDDHATILFAVWSATVQQETEQPWDAHRDPYYRKYDRYRIRVRREPQTVFNWMPLAFSHEEDVHSLAVG